MKPTTKQINAKGDARHAKNHDWIAYLLREEWKKGARWVLRRMKRR